MITFGYAKDYYYAGDGTLMIRVRIPSIHGAMTQYDYNGQRSRGYVQDDDLPYYPSLLLPHLPTNGEVVAVASLNDSRSNMMVIGLTGGSYTLGVTNVGG